MSVHKAPDFRPPLPRRPPELSGLSAPACSLGLCLALGTVAIPIDRPEVARVIVEIAAEPARVVDVVDLMGHQRQEPALAVVALA